MPQKRRRRPKSEDDFDIARVERLASDGRLAGRESSFCGFMAVIRNITMDGLLAQFLVAKKESGGGRERERERKTGTDR